jgi:hypothetical protein
MATGAVSLGLELDLRLSTFTRAQFAKICALFQACKSAKSKSVFSESANRSSDPLAFHCCVPVFKGRRLGFGHLAADPSCARSTASLFDVPVTLIAMAIAPTHGCAQNLKSSNLVSVGNNIGYWTPSPPGVNCRSVSGSPSEGEGP